MEPKKFTCGINIGIILVLRKYLYLCHLDTWNLRNRNINSWDKNWVSLLNDTDWMLVDTVFSNDQPIIDSISSPYIFYDGSLLRNNLLDAYYDSGLSEFSGITSPAGQGNFIILCDDYTSLTNKSRILEVVFKKSLLIELKNGHAYGVSQAHLVQQ